MCVGIYLGLAAGRILKERGNAVSALLSRVQTRRVQFKIGSDG
jgi:hypothetical protein